MKKLLKSMIAPGVLLFICVVSLAVLLKNAGDGVIGEVSSFESKVGENVIIRGDTLMIIDSNVWTQSYTLEDGRTVSPKFIEEFNKQN